jgi:hypothetical protein
MAMTFSPRKRESLADKAAECTAVQRRLKQSAAEAREKAAKAPAKPAKRNVSARSS